MSSVYLVTKICMVTSRRFIVTYEVCLSVVVSIISDQIMLLLEYLVPVLLLLSVDIEKRDVNTGAATAPDLPALVIEVGTAWTELRLEAAGPPGEHTTQ